MEFIPTGIEGCNLIRLSPHGDQRGYFVRTFCAKEFVENGLDPILAQSSYSFSARRGTLRGLHFQSAPSMEAKLVRCLRGAIFDVMVDIRKGSPTFGRWFGYELTEYNHMQIHSVRGFAHGFQTLTDDCVVAYHIAQFFDPEKTSGVRWDDPEIGVNWPTSPVDQSERDLSLPRLADIDAKTLINFEASLS